MIGIRIIFCLFLLALSSACERPDSAEPVDVLTQSPPSKDRIPVTVLVKNAFSINAFERMVEEKFPQIDIIQVGNFTSDRGIVEYKRRLEHDDLTDIIMTWPLDVGETHWESRLLDLSSMPFTSRYNTAMLNSIARDGKLYYLPGPAQVRGIVYNKTLFEEKGWKVPYDFNRFIALCRTIEASGIAPAIMTGYLMDLPVVFAKKKSPKTIQNALSTTVHSFTKDRDYEVVISADFLTPNDNVLFVDDFLAYGNAALGIIDLIKQSGANLVGMGFIIEKAFQNGRKKLEEQGVRVESLAIIEDLSNCCIKIKDE